MPIPNKTGDDGSIEMPIQAIFPVDITTDPMTYTMPCTLSSPGGAGIATVISVGAINQTATGQYLQVTAVQQVIQPAGPEFLRTPTIFKTPAIVASIGDNALWTPTAGKKFRVMGYDCMIPATTTSVGGVTVILRDGVTPFLNVAVVGTTSAAVVIHVVLPENGYLSTTINNVLNANLSAAATAGGFFFSIYGTEE